eukprot:6206195-Pleurochrysis_carterae.AAC.1
MLISSDVRLLGCIILCGLTLLNEIKVWFHALSPRSLALLFLPFHACPFESVHGASRRICSPPPTWLLATGYAVPPMASFCARAHILNSAGVVRMQVRLDELSQIDDYFAFCNQVEAPSTMTSSYSIPCMMSPQSELID